LKKQGWPGNKGISRIFAASWRKPLVGEITLSDRVLVLSVFSTVLQLFLDLGKSLAANRFAFQDLV
jgi:hypothetical protein